MREYTIKRGHNADINELVHRYFGVKGDVKVGVKFQAEGIGDVTMRQEKNILFVDIIPPKKVSGDYSVIKRWNQFLFEATGKDAKERKKELAKV
ncbi:MAG: DUF5611 family protein [Candidatus Thermoplasmatota archaeon]